MKELELLLKEQKRISKHGTMVELCEINKRIFAVREKLEQEQRAKRAIEKENNFANMVDKILEKQKHSNKEQCNSQIF